MNNLLINPSTFHLNHMYVALAIAESILEEEGYGLPHHLTLGEMNAEQVKEVFHEFVRSLKLEVLCHS